MCCQAEQQALEDEVVTWPTDWPAQVVEYYVALASEHRWVASVIEAVVSNVQYIRGLAASDRLRHYFADEFEGEQYFLQAVPDGDELSVIRQIVIDTVGIVHRYSWQRLEDDVGFLTDQGLNPAADGGPAPTTAAHFQKVWMGS